jgi:hypothetical protein
MTDETELYREPMPGLLKAVVVVLCLQVLANAYVGFSLLDDVNQETKYGGHVADPGWIFSFISFYFLVALILLVCVVLALRRYRWIRPTVVGIQVVNVMGSVANLLAGQFAALIGIALAAGLIALLSRDEVKEWFDR